MTDGGQVVGYLTFAGGPFHSFYWTANGGMVDLEPGPYGFGIAYSVNEAGQVTGTSRNLAYLWTQAGGMVDMPTL